MVACYCTYRNLMLPQYEIWDAFLPKGWKAHLHEDNQAMIRVIKSGKNPTMKTLKRCHGVDLLFLHERLSDSAGDGAGKNPNRDPCDLVDTKTDAMAADIYTKAFTNPEKWDLACQLINIIDTDSIEEAVKRKFTVERVSNAEQDEFPRGDDVDAQPAAAAATQKYFET